MKSIPLTIFLLLVTTGIVSAKSYQVLSPDGQLAVDISVNEDVRYEVTFKGRQILLSSPISMTFENDVVAGKNMKIKQAKVTQVDETITSVLPTKNRYIKDQYSQIEIQTSDNYSLVFRVYNDGVAYRFTTKFRKPTIVKSEEVVYNFAADFPMYFGQEESMFTHQERQYLNKKMSEFKEGDFCSPPMIVTVEDQIRVLITEADLENYGGMYVSVAANNALKGIFAHYALETTQKNDRSVPVTKYADYIAKVEGTRTYPWRLMVVADNDAEIMESEMVYKLADPCRLQDVSWIKPGKVAWDWWNACNIYGVDFQSGVNTQTYKYYIDFASKYGLEYIILDEGWYDIKKDLLSVVPEMDIAELSKYGQSKNVGIVLWTTWKALLDKEDEAFKRFSEWGIKGIKVDFMQRDDPYMVEYYYRIAEKAAAHHLLVDFHGNYKPTGLHRTFPNVISFEGVKGLENMKWSELPDPEHNTTLPFLRMVAGPMDYTPGGMLNSNKASFKVDWYRPRTLGTRCHQLGLYVVFESPLMMLVDNPSNYYREPVSMEFLSQVPTVWDETKVLKAQIGDFVVVARRSGAKWFIGAITDWTGREFNISLDFLPEGTYTLTSWEDGVNVKSQPADHAKRVKKVNNKETLTLKLAEGGGYVGVFEADTK